MSATSTYIQRTPTDVRKRRLLRAAKEEVRRLKAARAKGWTVTSEEMRRARSAVAAFSRRDPQAAKPGAKRPSGAIPKSTYYRSGASLPKYKKPSAKILHSLKITRVVPQGHRQWLVEFADNMGVNVHQGERPSSFFYALKVHDRVHYYDEAKPEPPEALAHAYQYAALTKIVPHQSAFHLMRRTGRYSDLSRSDLMADVHEDLYPSGRDASKRKRTVATSPKKASPKKAGPKKASPKKRSVSRKRITVRRKTRS